MGPTQIITPNPPGVIDQRLADLGDGVHDGVPGDPKLPGHLRHRPGVDPDLDAALNSGPAGEQTPRGELLANLGPRPQNTVSMRAPMSTLAPHQPDRPAEARQVPVLHLCPITADRRTTAPRTLHRARGRLDGKHQLRVNLGGLQHLEAGQAEHHLGNASSVRHVGDLTFAAALEKPQR